LEEENERLTKTLDRQFEIYGAAHAELTRADVPAELTDQIIELDLRISFLAQRATAAEADKAAMRVALGKAMSYVDHPGKRISIADIQKLHAALSTPTTVKVDRRLRRCAATLPSDPPQDCDAPFCGCDPAWG
jgi:hypothetical protein